MAKKKEQLQVLLWVDRLSYSGSDKKGKAYFYKDLKALMDTLLLGRGWYCLSAESKKDFIKDLGAGKIRHATVVKNFNVSQETNRFENLDDGDYFIDSRVTKDSVSEDYAIMDPNTRASFRYFGSYCKLGDVRSLNDEESAIMKDCFEGSMSVMNTDDVFNLFALLCVSKKVMKTYDTSNTDGKTYYDDKRQRSFLGYETYDLFTQDEVAKRTKEVEIVAHEAYKLTKALTGCDLFVKGAEHLDFVKCLVASRFLQNDDVEIRKGNPTITLKEVFQRVVDGKPRGDELDTAIKVCLDKMILETNSTNQSKRFPDDYAKPDGMLCVVTDCYQYNHRIKVEDFANIDKCVVWKNDKHVGATFTIYMWDETAMTYEMLGGDLEAFVNISKNK